MQISLLRDFSASAYINKITWIIKSVNLKRVCCATFVKHPHSVWALRSKVMFLEFSLTADSAFSSQDGWGWQGALEVLVSSPEAQAGSPQAQDCVQLAFECLWQRRCPSLSGPLVLVLLSWWKSFLMFRENLLCFSLSPLPLVPSLGTTKKSLALSLHFPFRYSCVRSPQAFSRSISLSCLFSSQERFCSPLIILVALPWALSMCSSLRWSHLCWAQGKDHPLNHCLETLLKCSTGQH